MFLHWLPAGVRRRDGRLAVLAGLGQPQGLPDVFIPARCLYEVCRGAEAREDKDRVRATIDAGVVVAHLISTGAMGCADASVVDGSAAGQPARGSDWGEREAAASCARQVCGEQVGCVKALKGEPVDRALWQEIADERLKVSM